MQQAARVSDYTAFMYLAAMYKPDFRTINDFRKDNTEFIQKAFVHIVQVCKGLGMCKAGALIIDSTKLKANASANVCTHQHARTYAHPAQIVRELVG